MRTILQKSMVLALLYYAFAIVGCTRCKCRNAEFTEYKFKELSVQNISYAFAGDTAFTVTNSIADTVQRKEFGISMMTIYDLAFVKFNKANFGLINTANACDCNVGGPYSDDIIDSISIVTLYDLDDTHPAGSSVNEYFKVVSASNSGKLTYYPLNYAIENGLFQSKKDLYFTNPNGISKTVAFEINIKTKTAKSSSAKTKPVFLK